MTTNTVKVTLAVNMVATKVNKKQKEQMIKDLEKEISKRVAACFSKAKEAKVDIFEAYEQAYREKYKITSSNYKTMEEFLEKLKLNVEVDIRKLDY